MEATKRMINHIKDLMQAEIDAKKRLDEGIKRVQAIRQTQTEQQPRSS